MQSCHTWRKILVIVRKNSSKPKMLRELKISFEKRVISKKFLWTCGIMIWQSCRIFLAKEVKGRSKWLKIWNNIFYHRTGFLKVLLSGNIEYSPDNRVGNILPEGSQLFPQSPKTTVFDTRFSGRFFSSKLFTGHLECKVVNPDVIFPLTSKGISIKFRTRILIFCRRKFFW